MEQGEECDCGTEEVKEVLRLYWLSRQPKSLMELTSHKLVKPKMPEDFTSLVDVLFDGSFIYLYLFVLISTLGLPGVGSVLSTKRL